MNVRQYSSRVHGKECAINPDMLLFSPVQMKGLLCAYHPGGHQVPVPQFHLLLDTASRLHCFGLVHL
jgi:hypothetical protein